MCHCINIDIGSYRNQVELISPFSESPICVDRCLEDEIQFLWELGIVTTGCCCGHNQVEAYIGVVPIDIDFMKLLGYQVKFNECRPNDEDSFTPKFNI